jgi:hypothetical protein
MLAPERAERESERSRPWADLLSRHRERWVASLSGDESVLWMDDYAGEAGDAESLRAAAAEGRPIVVGLSADAAGAGAREAARLAGELGGVTVHQRLAAGSLIGADDGEGADADTVHFLVCANVSSVADASSSLMDAAAVPLMTGYVRYLEDANRSLSEANARLARASLGVHDSAAAAIVAELKANRETAEALRAELSAPRYRAVDKLRDLLFEVPGLSALLRRRSRMIQGRSGQG